MDEHNSIYEILIRLEGKVEKALSEATQANSGVKRINGSIVDVYKQIEDNRKRTEKNKEVIDNVKGAGKFIHIIWGFIVVIVGWVMWFFSK